MFMTPSGKVKEDGNHMRLEPLTALLSGAGQSLEKPAQSPFYGQSSRL